jgi:hypothetical protein
MAPDKYLDREVAIAVTATAAALSPRVRQVLRRGAVYGVAGALKATDVVTAAARGAMREMNPQSEPVVSSDEQEDAPAERPRTKRA